MGGRGDVADEVQERTPANAHHKGVPIDTEFDQPVLKSRQQRRVVLDLFAAWHTLRRGHQFHGIGMHAGIARNVMLQRRKRGCHVGIDEDDEAMAPPGLAPKQRVAEGRVVVSEQALGEVNGVFVANRERLQVDR